MRDGSTSRDLTVGTPWRRIVAFALPLLFGNVFQVAYNLADTAIIGNAAGPVALAGVGIATPVFNFYVALLAGFSIGASIVVAQRFGAHDADGLRSVVSTVITLSVLLAAVLTVAGLILIDPLLTLLGAPADAYPHARAYLILIVCGLTFSVFYNQLTGMLRGIGDSKTPLYFLIFSSAVNVGLDCLFVISLGWGVAGAAWATIIAQGLSVALVAWHIKRRVPEFCLRRDQWHFDKEMLKKVFFLGLPLAIQQSSIQVGNILMQGAVNTLGTATIAAYAGVLKVNQFATMPILSMGLSLSTYSAQNLGAGREDRVSVGLRSANIMLVIICVVVSTLVIVFRGPLAAMFVGASGSELIPDVIACGSHFLIIVAGFYILLAFVHSFANVMAGAGDTVFYMVSMIAMTATRVLVAWVCGIVLGMGWTGVCIAYPCSYALTLIIVLVYYRAGRWRGKVAA